MAGTEVRQVTESAAVCLLAAAGGLTGRWPAVAAFGTLDGKAAAPFGDRPGNARPDMTYLWLKGLHIAFMVTWFAGLFYLPRLFIYHAEADDEIGRSRFTTMETRLYAIMTIGAILTAAFGIALIWLNPPLLDRAWFRVKLALIVGMFVYHFLCRRWILRLAAATTPQPTRGLRWFNEIPVIFLLAIVLLATLKPVL